MEAPEKDKIKELRERLMVSPRLVWDQADPAAREAITAYVERYKSFLDLAKTEREAVVEIERQAQARGFVDLGANIPGPRTYYNYKGKTMVLAVAGRRPPSEGFLLVAAHIDSPRLDRKQYPLYEDTDLVFLQTQYYGGIKKYQWLTRPLSLHGVIIKTDGSRVKVVIGEEEGDPVFTITDLLPHLARRTQYEKKLPEKTVAEKLS